MQVIRKKRVSVTLSMLQVTV